MKIELFLLILIFPFIISANDVHNKDVVRAKLIEMVTEDQALRLKIDLSYLDEAIVQKMHISA